VLPSPTILRIGAVGFAAMFVEVCVSNWSGVYLHTEIGASAGFATSSYTVFVLMMALCRLRGNAMVKRFGVVPTIVTASVVGTAGAATAAIARAPWTVMVAIVAIGVGISVVLPLAVAAGGRADPIPSRGIAGVSTLTYTAAFTAPSVFGAIAGGTSLSAAFGILALLVAAVGFGARYLNPTVVEAGVRLDETHSGNRA
jgi:MFS family permease